MHAERRLDNRADLVQLQRIHRLLEFRHGIARIQPAEIAALGGRTILRIEAGLLGEIDAVGDPLAHTFQFAPGFGLRHHFIDPDQDVPCLGLLDGGHGAATPLGNQLDDMEAG